MLLKDLLTNMDYEILNGNLNKNITELTFDSRRAIAGSMFIAIQGFTVDGHDKISQAIEKGATTVIVEKDIDNVDATIIKVKSTRDALARLSVNFYEHPAESLNVIGITGTNGKTSITQFLNGILREANLNTGMIGTMGTTINREVIETNNTTPESLDIQRFLKTMKDENHDYCLMEVSSHALNLKRAAYTTFSTGIFTNLSPDHLELHKTMDEYFEAKAILFNMTEKFNIINADDFYGQQLIKRLENNDTEAKTLTYGIHEKADFYATNIEYHFNYTDFTLHTPFETEQMRIHLPGEIYVSNSLAAIAAAYSNGIPLDTIRDGLNQVRNISGRFEVVYEKDDFRVIVDFAHTEDALQKTISILKNFVKGKIIVVFGVYADMSESGTEKRYGMGRVAAEYADLSVVTLDNPKHHDPELIMKETIEAIERNKGEYIAIPDREEAIRYAINISEKEDFILLAGKGHERTQVIGSQAIEFSEKDIVTRAMKEKVFN